MAYRVVLTDKAEADVESVLKWFCDQRATEAGGRWYAQLVDKLDTLENPPERCSATTSVEQLSQLFSLQNWRCVSIPRPDRRSRLVRRGGDQRAGSGGMGRVNN